MMTSPNPCHILLLDPDKSGQGLVVAGDSQCVREDKAGKVVDRRLVTLVLGLDERVREGCCGCPWHGWGSARAHSEKDVLKDMMRGIPIASAT